MTPQELLEGDARFEPRQGRPEAEVGTVAERQVPVDPAPYVEAVGVGELPVVQVGGAPHEHHPGAGGDEYAVALDVSRDRAGQGLGGGGDAQHLLDGVGHERGVGGEGRPLVGVAGEELDTVAQEARGRVVAADDQEEAEPEQLLLAQSLAVDIGPEEGAHEVVGRLVATSDEQVADQGVHATRGPGATPGWS